MKTLELYTNINCDNCIAKVKPFLDKLSGVSEWSVDISTPEKRLIVSGDAPEKSEIIKALHEAGYEVFNKRFSFRNKFKGAFKKDCCK